MNRKQKALRALVILAVVIALCMFFSRTVQTITTPKVQRISATKGKLEQKIALTGAIYFDQTAPYKVTDAQKLGITVDQVSVRAGYYVEAGDVLFTAIVPEYDTKMAELREKYETKVKEAANEYASNIRLLQTSKQNAAYTVLQAAYQKYYDARYQVVFLASAAGYVLPGEESWNALADAPAELTAAVAAYQAASDERDAASATLKDIYKTGKGRVGDGTFEYIKKIDNLHAEAEAIQEEMLALDVLARSLTSVKAPHAGYVTALDLKEGDEYNGSKAAYEMSAEGTQPVLRVDISSVDKTILPGCKAELAQNGVAGEVKEVITGSDGKKYALITLDSSMIKSLGGMTRLVSDKEMDVTLIYKAQKSATLLPASAVRSDGGSEYYVYTIERSYGGILDSSNYKVVKNTVNVIEKSDQIVAVSDDLSYREIADREDRALKDGQAVMDYVD